MLTVRRTAVTRLSVRETHTHRKPGKTFRHIEGVAFIGLTNKREIEKRFQKTEAGSLGSSSFESRFNRLYVSGDDEIEGLPLDPSCRSPTARPPSDSSEATTRTATAQIDQIFDAFFTNKAQGTRYGTLLARFGRMGRSNLQL